MIVAKQEIDLIYLLFYFIRFNNIAVFDCKNEKNCQSIKEKISLLSEYIWFLPIRNYVEMYGGMINTEVEGNSEDYA